VPPGKTFNDVKLPPSAITSSVKGMGEKIVELKVADNTRTQSNTIEYVSGLKIGMILNEKLLEDAYNRLHSTGLFKQVSITWEAPSPRYAGQGIRIVIRALDKFPWVIAPIFSYQQRNYGGGAAFAHNNLLGRGIKLLLYGDYTTAEKMLLGVWLDPSIRNTPFYYRFDVILRRDNIVEYARGRLGDPRVERATDVDTVGVGAQLGVNIARRFHIDLRLKIYYDWVRTPECYNTTNVDFSGTPDVVAAQGGYCRAPSSSGWDNTLTTSMGWDGRSKVNGVQKGLQITLTWQYGATWLGDNWNYHLVNLTAVYAFRFFKEHNLILRLGGDLDFSPPFKLEVEAGSLEYTLRGSIYRQFRGDTSVRATLEYILPLFWIKGLAVRAIAFYDTNLTWFRDLPEQNSPGARLVPYGNGFRNYLPDTVSGVARDSWNNGIGGGIRMYLRGVVLPLVGFDVAYGIEANAPRYYLSIGSVLD
jgi:outer membrane protein assembly factor BamA